MYILIAQICGNILIFFQEIFVFGRSSGKEWFRFGFGLKNPFLPGTSVIYQFIYINIIFLFNFAENI